MKTATGKILRVLRKRKGFSQAVLAEKLEKSQSYVSRVELGKKNLTEKEITHFLSVLKISHQSYESLLKTETFLEEVAIYQPSAPTKKNKNLKEQKSKEELLNIVREYFLHQPVKSAYIFGSVARNEHT
ncbi:MAG: helix-turn-helix domain-containing protein, partial [Bacteroidota bacterium]